MTRIFATPTGLILRGLNEVVRTVIGQKVKRAYSRPENPERLVYAINRWTISKSKDGGVVCLSVMSRCSYSTLPQDKALGTLPAIVIPVTDQLTWIGDGP
jgi:hypothetical protein